MTLDKCTPDNRNRVYALFGSLVRVNACKTAILSLTSNFKFLCPVRCYNLYKGHIILGEIKSIYQETSRICSYSLQKALFSVTMLFSICPGQSKFKESISNTVAILPNTLTK